VVEAGRTPGKFTFVPTADTNRHRSLRPGAHYLSEDWESHCKARDIEFAMRWIPFVSEKETPLDVLTEPWLETHAVPVGSVTFPKMDPGSREGRLLALLAAQMGANPGHWVGTRPDEPRPEFPGTRFTAARQLAYALGQQQRQALPEGAYRDFFTNGGVIGPDLERELLLREEQKQPVGPA
jgi:hypothetical protein